MGIKKRNWQTFFSPESVAVIGASQSVGKIGYDVLKNLAGDGYKGKIFPINPKADSMFNLKAYPSVLDVPGKLDLAVFVIPSHLVADTLEDCGKKGVGSAVIISSGFKEIGQEGKVLEDRVAEIANKYNINTLGPNCLGLIDMNTSLNASFAANMPLKGNVAFISQSGALGTAILDWAIKEGLGFSKFISLGNKVDVNEVDLINALCDDPQTKAILCYIEDVKDGRAFLDVVRKATMKKPVIITKSGCTQAGAKAASSHTGSLAGSDNAFNAAFLQTGVIRAEMIENLFDFALAFSYQPVCRGNNIAVITNAGGPGIMATDSIEKNPNLKMASLSADTTKKLKGVLPSASAVNNPVDVMGDAADDRYKKALDIVLDDPNVDGTLVILTPQSSSKIIETSNVIVEKNKSATNKKPIFTSFLGGGMVEKGIENLSRNKIPNYPFPERAASSFEAMVRYNRWVTSPKGNVIQYPVGKEKTAKIISSLGSFKGVISEDTARDIAKEYGFKFPQNIIAKTADEAVKLSNQIGYPIVMKIASKDISHKSDAGGVVVGLSNDEAVRKSFDTVIKNAKKYLPTAVIDGVNIQEMVREGQEIIIGSVTDPQFGPMIMFGLGGIYVEVFKDVAFKIAPLTDSDAQSMIRQIKAYPLIKGVRGHEGFDESACQESILRLSQLVTDFPQIAEMDINPLKVMTKSKGGAIAIDIRIRV